jgi:NADP-dependent 3-hydroxy acid dehydrogenase YdfG
VAHAVQKIWPDATFVSLSTGHDFLNADLGSLQNLIGQHNTFINSSYVAPGVQLRLLNLVRETWKFGHVINLGSTHEFDQQSDYGHSKRALRDCSLSLHDYRFRTTHLILGGINDGDPAHAEWLSTDSIAHAIKWVVEQPFDVPLLNIQAEKQPW